MKRAAYLSLMTLSAVLVGSGFVLTMSGLLFPMVLKDFALVSFFGGFGLAALGMYLAGPAGVYQAQAEREALLAKQTWTPCKAPIFWKG